jgi:hypothetical protein
MRTTGEAGNAARYGRCPWIASTVGLDATTQNPVTCQASFLSREYLLKTITLSHARRIEPNNEGFARWQARREQGLHDWSVK